MQIIPIMKVEVSLVVTACICAVLCDEDPLVTLSHGGQLRGKSIKYKDSTVDAYLGVRYAKAPTNNLRFKRPEPVDGWEGILDARQMGNICLQVAVIGDPAVLGQAIGDEDCLFLDVWTPPKSKLTEKKAAVMVWIHGGGYQMGSGQQTMVTVPYDGDVILVSINYRLGLFGFLNDGSQGSGNFGLWDQRQALIWVQENIAAFGGDVDRVTIFGESAGAGSVNCQSLSPKNNGLFHRVIQQSGTCMTVWSIATSSQDRKAISDRLRGYMNCSQSLFNCFNGLTASEAFTTFERFTNARGLQFSQLTVPHQDGDFFREDILNFEYTGQERFDYMAGFNGQEGNLFMFTISAMAFYGTNLTLEKDGIPEEYLQSVLRHPMACGVLPFGSELCTEYVTKLYKLDEKIDNQERAYRVSKFGGELFFNADTRHGMDKFASSGSKKQMYSYYFTENKIYQNGSLLWPTPKWLKRSADHADELWYLFKPVDLLDEYAELVKQISGDEDLKGHQGLNLFESMAIKQLDKSMKPVSDMMLTLWTNFAKTGNPNKPVKVKGVPEWVPYTGDDGLLMELNSKPQLVKFPDRGRVTKLFNTVNTLYKEYKVKERQLPTTDGVEVFIWSLEPYIASKLIYGLLATIIIIYVMSYSTKRVTEPKRQPKLVKHN